MRLIDRLNKYLELKGITPHVFEQTCGLSNGYIGKQLHGKGSVGSDILEKIANKYPELNLVWLITGKGKVEVKTGKTKENEWPGLEMKEMEAVYKAGGKIIEVLKEQMDVISSSLPVQKKNKKS